MSLKNIINFWVKVLVMALFAIFLAILLDAIFKFGGTFTLIWFIVVVFAIIIVGWNG